MAAKQEGNPAQQTLEDPQLPIQHLLNYSDVWSKRHWQPQPCSLAFAAHMAGVLDWLCSLPAPFLCRCSWQLQHLCCRLGPHSHSFMRNHLKVCLQGFCSCNVYLPGFLLKSGWKPPRRGNSYVCHAFKICTTWMVARPGTIFLVLFWKTLLRKEQLPGSLLPQGLLGSCSTMVGYQGAWRPCRPRGPGYHFIMEKIHNMVHDGYFRTKEITFSQPIYI